jgi:hypothetical protein|tara:strand:- start:1615 stop:1962 length:348 start_codon:yes stop_codon:yes gene_type:complete
MSDSANASADLKNKIGDMEINAGTIVKVLQLAMEVVETTPVKGAEQKELAIKLVRQAIVDAPIADEKEKLLLDIIEQGVLGNTLDLVIMASKGELDVNAIVDVATGCCASFMKRK